MSSQPKFFNGTLLVSVCLGALAVLPLSGATLTFVPVSIPAGGGGGIIWSDFDNDGKLDAFISDDPDRLLWNNQTNFTKAAGQVVSGTGRAAGAVAADYDNDGISDLFVAAGFATGNLLYHNNGDRTFTRVSNIITSDSGWNGLWLDYDNDGWLDLFVTTSYAGGRNLLYRNNGDGTFAKITNHPFSSDLPNQSSQGAAWGDYDNDGLPDLFVANARDVNTGAFHPAFLYHNLGGGRFEKITNSIVTTNLLGLASCAWGDYDNDGKIDLFVCGVGTGGGSRRVLYHNDGNGLFSIAKAGPVNSDTGIDQSCAWVDYDNDGYLDLFVANAADNCTLYHNNGDGTFTKSTLPPTQSGGWVGCAWDDYNNDGFPDLLLANYGSSSRLYMNTGNSNNWFKVRCTGRITNRSAIGTRVKVAATIHGTNFWQIRDISAGTGEFNQSSSDCLFGLGDATNVTSLVVQWPSGITQSFNNLESKQVFHVIEPSKIENIALGSSGASIQVHAGKGFVYTLQATSDLVHWTPLSTLTNTASRIIFQVDGQNLGSGGFFRVVEQ